MRKKSENTSILNFKDVSSHETNNQLKKKENLSLKFKAISIEKVATSWAKKFKYKAVKATKNTKESYQKSIEKTITKEQKSKHRIDTGVSAVTSAASGIMTGLALTLAGIAHAAKNISDNPNPENETNKPSEKKNDINSKN